MPVWKMGLQDNRAPPMGTFIINVKMPGVWNLTSGSELTNIYMIKFRTMQGGAVTS